VCFVLKIESVYAFVALDESGDEGICGFFDETTNMAVPMVGADLARISSLRPIAQQIADEGRGPIKLLRFTTRTDLEEIKGGTIGRNDKDKLGK
jgi:hypothetical protein